MCPEGSCTRPPRELLFGSLGCVICGMSEGARLQTSVPGRSVLELTAVHVFARAGDEGVACDVPLAEDGILQTLDNSK